MALLPALVVVALAVASAPLTRARATAEVGEVPQDGGSCQDPAFHWMRETVTEPSTVLAPFGEDACVAAQVAPADVLSLRGQVRSVRESTDVLRTQQLLDAPLVLGGLVEVLARRDVDLLVLRAGSSVDEQLQHLPGLSRLDAPGDRYAVYEVEAGEMEATPAVEADSALFSGDNEAALKGYLKIVEEGGEDERFLAHGGVGYVYASADLHDEAAGSYERAVELYPRSPIILSLMAETLASSGDPEAARVALEKAIELAPRDVGMRDQLATLQAESGDTRGALAQRREIVETYPNVPVYRVDLGEALLGTGDARAAEREFERAVALAPLSTEVRTRVQEARLHYETPR